LEFLPEDLNLVSWLMRINEFVAKQRIDVVMPVSDFRIRAFSEHRKSLVSTAKLAYIPQPHIFDIATNKTSLTAFLAPRPSPTNCPQAGKEDLAYQIRVSGGAAVLDRLRVFCLPPNQWCSLHRADRGYSNFWPSVTRILA
jgi:hypothetical protein